MAIHYTDTIYQGVNHHGMQVGFVYDNIGMIYVKAIDSAGIDIRVLPKQEQDYFYDLLRGDDLGTGTSFPGTKKYGDRFYRTDESKWYKWDGYDWCVYGETYYLMLDYFPTKSGYLETGARVYRTDEDKEYRYSGSAWVEITATSGDTKKRIQSKDNMTVVTSNNESSSFYYRINPTDILISEHWFVVPLAKFLGTGDSSAGLQVYWGKAMYSQRFYCYTSYIDGIVEDVWLTLISQETNKPISDITHVQMTRESEDVYYYDVFPFIGGLYYRKFEIDYSWDCGEAEPCYDTHVDDLTGVIGRLLCDEYDKTVHTESHGIVKYVNDTTGLDTNNGSESTPWKTISHAAANVIAGTLIRIAAGTYAESSDIIPANAGTLSSYIHFKGDGDVILTGYGFHLLNKPYVIIDNLIFNNAAISTEPHVGILTEGSSDYVLIINCTFKNYVSPSFAAMNISGWYNSIIANTFENFSGTNMYGIIIYYGEYSKIIYNIFNIEYVYTNYNDTTTFIYAFDPYNDIGNYYVNATNDPEDNCISLTSFEYELIVDPVPIIVRGSTFNLSTALNWLDTHYKYGVNGVLAYALNPFMLHTPVINVPAAGATVPHSFVKVIDENSEERLVAYSNKTEGTDYGACEIGENGEIIDGMDNVKIQSVNGTNYSINPISRILDRNANGDIIIEGRSIIHE